MNIKVLNTAFNGITRTIKHREVPLKKAANIAVEDLNHKSFELRDMLKYLSDNSELSDSEKKAIVSFLRDGKTVKEIASEMGVHPETIRQRLKNAGQKMNQKYSQVSSPDYISGRAKSAQTVVNASDKKEASYMNVDGNYFYKY